MRRLHFETLKPVCPACRRPGRDMPLALEAGAVCIDDNVRSGVLRCTAADCGQRFPIIDGAPVLVPDVASWLSSNLHLVLQGDIDCAEAEAVVGAAVGPEAAFNISRQQQASYAHDHYGDLFDETGDGAPPGSIRRCQQIALERLNGKSGENTSAASQPGVQPVLQPALDVGCAVGRTTFDLAASGTRLALGIDLNWPLLRIARQIIDHGLLQYPHRRIGNRYDRLCRKVAFPADANVDFWIADALSMPFRSDTFGLALGLNVIDCVPDPARLIVEMSRVVGPGGGVGLATPFDWAPHATPYAAWIDDAPALDGLVTALGPVAAAMGGKPLSPTAPGVDLAWSLRLHDRAAMTYTSRLQTLRV